MHGFFFLWPYIAKVDSFHAHLSTQLSQLMIATYRHRLSYQKCILLSYCKFCIYTNSLTIRFYQVGTLKHFLAMTIMKTEVQKQKLFLVLNLWKMLVYVAFFSKILIENLTLVKLSKLHFTVIL